MAYEFYKPAQPADLSQQFHDYSQAVPGAGFAVAARALRESLDRAAARRDRASELQDSRNWDEKQRIRSEAFQTIQADKRFEQDERARIRSEAFQAVENEKTRSLQLGISMMNNWSEQARSTAQARARVESDRQQQRDEADRQAAATLTQSIVAAEKTKKDSSIFRRVKVSPAQVLYTNQGEDELVSTFMGANSAARPYLNEQNSESIKQLVKQAVQGRDLMLQDPSQFDGFRNSILNQVTQRTNGVLTPAIMRGVDETLAKEFGSIPSSELDAAKALDDELRSKIKDIFGTPAPAANQTQQLPEPGIAGPAAREPRPFTLAPGDLSQDLLVRVGGSAARAEQLKQALFSGAIGEAGQAPELVPVQNDDGTLSIALDTKGATLDPALRMRLESVLNEEGPMRQRLIARMRLGNQDATDAELNKVGRAGGSTPAGPAVQPSPSAQPAGVPVGGALLKYLNGQPKQ